MGKENNRTHENPENKTVIVLMLQAGLAAPISRGNSNSTDQSYPPRQPVDSLVLVQ